MDGAENMLIKRHQTQKDHMLYDAMHVRYPKYVNLQNSESRSVASDFLHGPYKSMEFSRPNYWNG